MFKDELINAAADMFHVHPRDLVGDYRFNFLMPARFALAKALHLRGWSYVQIGRELGRDHTTIMYRVREAGHRMRRDLKFAEKVQRLATMKLDIAEGEIAA